MIRILFYIALIGILHTYVIYPLLMRFLGLFAKRKRASENPDFQPSVEIIFAAYNEEDVIHEKIIRSINSHYPPEKLSIRIGSDASTDKTDTIIKSFMEKHPRLHFRRFKGRTGKAGIISALAKESTADLLIFTDANILFEPETIPALVMEMHDPKTGMAGGKILYTQVQGSGISVQENVYLQMENSIKACESDIFGKAMGVEGGCYIIRKELFPGIPPLFFMEDFYVTLTVMQKGYKVKFLPEARCYEDVSVHSTEEYKRKVRISIGNFQNLGHFWKMMFTNFFPEGFIFLSHKVLRWLTPFFLLILMVTSTLLASSGMFYALFAGFYMLFIGLGMFGILFSQSKKAGLLKYPGHFIYMNLALLEGFSIYLKGVKSNAWQPTRRNQK